MVGGGAKFWYRRIVSSFTLIGGWDSGGARRQGETYVEVDPYKPIKTLQAPSAFASPTPAARFSGGIQAIEPIAGLVDGPTERF